MTSTNKPKRLFTDMKFSPESESHGVHKYTRIKSPEPEALPADTPEWARVMYSSINVRTSAVENCINDALSFSSDTATAAYTETGINKVCINNLENQHDNLATSLHKLELENKSLKERLINQECQSRRDNLLFHGFKKTLQRTVKK